MSNAMNPETEVSDLLRIVMPPTRLRIWLHKFFAAKQEQGQPVPEDFTAWLGIVDRICSDLPHDIDGITPAQWQWIERKIFAHRPTTEQPALLDIPKPAPQKQPVRAY